MTYTLINTATGMVTRLDGINGFLPTGELVPRVDGWREGDWVVSYSPTGRISKNAIWERATDGEAEAMDAMLWQQPVRLQRIYEGATHISTDHELYDLLEHELTQAFGAQRAAELLEPTE